jgi:hypothetical protein
VVHSTGSRSLLLLVAATLLMALMALPVFIAPSERVFGNEIAGRHHDPFTVIQQFAGAAVPSPYLQPATDWVGRVLARAMSPVAAYNVVVLSSFPLAALFAYLLAHAITGSWTASAIAALIFAFAPFHVAQAAYHPHIAQVHWIPLFFLALWQSVRGATLAKTGLLIVASACVVLSNFYGGLIAATMAVVTVPVFWLIPQEPGQSRRLATRGLIATCAILAAFGAVGVIAAYRFVPMLVEHPEAFAVPRESLFPHSARWWSYFVPPVDHVLSGGWAHTFWRAHGFGPGLVEQQVYIGCGVLALTAMALLAWTRGREDKLLRSVPYLMMIGAFAFICSLSPEHHVFGMQFPGPSALLYAIAPMFRSYARFAVVVSLMAAIVAGIGMTWAWQQGSRTMSAMALVFAGLVVFEYAPVPWRWRDVLPTSAHRWLAAQGGSVRALDCSPWAPAEAQTAWLAGYPIDYAAASIDCAGSDTAAQLRAGGVTHMIVRAAQPEFRPLGARPRPAFRAVYLADDAAVFEVEPQRPVTFVSSLRVAYPREFSGVDTWRWSSDEMHLTVENLSSQPCLRGIDLELNSFGGTRHVSVSLDGREIAPLIVLPKPTVYRLGPVLLPPGRSEIRLRSIEPPVVADTLLSNGDPRALTLAVREWTWVTPAGGQCAAAR